MSPALTLVLGVAVAYLATHVAFDWIARRFLIVSGAEYLLLGILLGPQVSGLLDARTVESVWPIATVALGWIGVIVGMQFRLVDLVRIPGVTYRLAFAESLATLALVAAACGAVITYVLGLDPRAAIVPALALGGMAATSSPAGIEVAARRLGWRGPVVRQLQVSTAVDAAVAVATIGLLACVQRPALGGGLVRTPTATEWAVLSVGIGVVGGALFHLFLGGERKVDRVFVSLGGAIILVTGAAVYLRVSPLLPAMIVGAILANTSSSREEIAETLARGERPFYFVLLLFAGVAWQASAPAGLLAVLAFVLARVAGKVGGAWLGARVNGMLPVVGPHWGRALLGQGGLALALALDYLRQPAAPLTSVVFTAAVLSVLVTDLSQARLVQSVLLPLKLREGDGERAASTAARATRPPSGDAR